MAKVADIPKSMQGKHDYQLQNELRELFKEHGLSPIISVERRRGRIKVECNEGDYLLTTRLVRQLHPDFTTREFTNGFVLLTDTV